MYKKYEYVVIGGGIAGICTAYFLCKHSNSVLLVEEDKAVLNQASKAAGGFLSPLLGKDNTFKSLVNNALKFSVDFYKNILKDDFENKGVYRLAKNEEDRLKFDSYKPFMDFDYKEYEDGFFFDIGSKVSAKDVANALCNDFEIALEYKVKNIKQNKDEKWIINNEIEASKVILTTGYKTDLIDESYFQIRAVWGQRIDILTSTQNSINYHKECSVSSSKKYNNKNLICIGATHHRLDNYTNLEAKEFLKQTQKQNTEKLLSLAEDIIKLDDIEVVNTKIGARACSVDYFPIVGELIDSKKTIEKYPHLVNGSFVTDDKLIKKKGIYVLNGIGGRGFVLSPYLANCLVDYLVNNKPIQYEVLANRLFKRWVKKIKLNNC